MGDSMHHRTKIVATVGPACDSEEMLLTLMNTGVNVFRLNFSHGTQASKATLIQTIRNLSQQQQMPIAIMGDLQGPKIRVGALPGGSMELQLGTEVTITTRTDVESTGVIPTIYQQLPKDVKPGDQILLDDGLLELEVLSVVAQDVRCKVQVGGILKDHKGINLPGVNISAPALSDKDREDLQFCISKEVDYVALSFVRCVADVLELKEILTEQQSDLRIVSKIEKPEAVTNFAAILDASDGIMVARGDLGVEISPEKVPLIQKQIIRQCNAVGKPVITATQMLESMIEHPRPTRAETSDVANAILDGTDAIMLSAETAVGHYPVEAVSLMVRIAEDVEKDPALRKHLFPPLLQTENYHSLAEGIGQAACQVAENVGASAIIAFTQTGKTATLIAKYRPALPIYAVTPSIKVQRQLALYSGVASLQVEIKGDTETQIHTVEETILKAEVLHKGDVVVITMGSPVSTTGTTNLMKLHQLGNGGDRIVRKPSESEK